MDLTGKVIAVTGGNSGIGMAIAEMASRRGAKVVIDWVVHPEDTDTEVHTLTDEGHTAVGVRADVSQVADLQKIVDTAVQTFGRLDCWVSNAGIETRTALLDTTEAQYDRLMTINLKSAFFGAQLAARQMIAQGGGGSIINISSVHEDWPMPGNAAYCVSKGGMRMLTRTAACELGAHNIRMVNVGPGAIATPINAATEADQAAMGALDKAIPLGRIGQPDEVAGLVCWLASDEASYATATTFFVDGGIMQGSVGL